MKKLIILAALSLTACSAKSYPPDQKDIALWTDPSTGCVYINYRDGGLSNWAVGSLSIRYRADGKPDCPGDPQ